MVSTSAGLLDLVTAAVTPVVMISADAVLIMGVNQKHAALSERLRALAAEFRAPDCPPERREAIRAQVRIFALRFRCAAAAHLWLYAAVMCFVGMVLIITLTARGQAWYTVALSLFVLGIALTLGAVVAELFELRLAERTVDIEIRDLLGAEQQGVGGDG